MNEPQLYVPWVGHRNILLNGRDAMKIKTVHIHLFVHVHNMCDRISIARRRN